MAPDSRATDERSRQERPTDIRSFVRREGRITTAQARALRDLWPRYGLNTEGPATTPNHVFGRTAFCSVEIGFGNGESLLEQAQAQPDQDFIGIEVYRPGVGRLLRRIEELGLSNVRIFNADAQPIFHRRLQSACIDRVVILFPDPWPKKRHHKRRLIHPDFVALIARVLKPGGELWLATDWRDYALHMLTVMNNAQDFVSLAPEGGFHPHPADRPLTKFERRGQRLGHGVWDLRYRRVAG